MHKRSLIPLAVFALAGSVFAGGPTIESNNLRVGKIISTPDEIIMEVEGTFDLLTQKTPEEGTTNGNGKKVGMVIHNGLLKIPRKRWKHPGGDAFEVYLDWDKYREEIKQWEGKQIFTQMWATQLVVKDGSAHEIISEHCKISDKHKP